MRIATFNCNSIRVRLPAIVAWLERYSPDVLALQETKAVDADFPADAIRDKGWHVVYRGEKSYNGVAVISRNPPESHSFGLGDDDGESETRLARVRVDGIDVVNTYVPQGGSMASEKFEFKLQWLNRLNSYFSRNFDLEKDRLAWVGDVNIAPRHQDVYDWKAVWPDVCHCQEVMDSFAGFLSLGFTDIFRKHLPQEGVFTFWDFRQRGALERNRGWRIDHILATSPLAGKSMGCLVDIEPRKGERPSDHTFVYADFS